ncbi:MAG: ABC-F family ATP-binding cassette domain-containing protein, partial [Erysipelotrichaceae bacterium]|nr:ABC-F family ATP-binding cassette domain-containing protein [Erysipelotrichaceae bacterium]
VFSDVIALENELNAVAKQLETNPDETILKKYEELQTRFEAMDGYQYEVELKNVFFHFQFSEEDLRKPLSQFSSGQRTRIALVKLLLSKPDVLLLDEPTNHLDIESMEWLENYLKQYPKAIILVSHDRMFLDHVVDEVVEIEYGKTTKYKGNYSQYVLSKQQMLEKNQSAYLRQQKEIEKLERFIERFRSKSSKASAAKSKQKSLDRLQRLEKQTADTKQMKASFTCARQSGQRVLEVRDCQYGYSDTVLGTASFSLFKQQRLAVIGKNGIGKSTLLKTLINQIPAISGTVHWGHHVDIGYFDQDSALNQSESSVLDVLWNVSPQATQTQIRNVLARFLFTQEEVFKDVSVLSGGEKVRLALAVLMMRQDNVLVLDEPTNHLDIASKEALEEALLQYPGTILFVSHDRMFLNKISTCVLEVDENAVYSPCSYQEYIEKGPAESLIENQTPLLSKEVHKDQKAIKNRIAKLESLIKEAEEDLEQLRELRYEPEYYQDYTKMDALNEQIDEKHNEINRFMQEWEEKMNESQS